MTASRVKARSKKAPSLSKLAKMSWVELLGLVIGWVLRWCGRTAWRCRAGLMPVWWCVAFLFVGWIASGWPEFWAAPISVGLVVASVLWFVGEKLSPHAQSMWLWLVPDGLDDGKAGVLDRPTERGYLCLLLLGGGAWLSARMQYGWTQDIQLALLVLLAVLGLPWWWHRGFRRRKPLNLYVRRWPRVEQNEDLKVWHGSKVVRADTASNTTLLVVKLRGGRTVRHVAGDALILCSVLGLRPGAITVAVDPNAARRVLVRVVPRDPWGGPVLHPMPPLRSIPLDTVKSVVVGKFEDGTDDVLRITQSLLCVGATGSGKSEWLQSLLAYIFAFDHSAVVAADLANGATFDVWEGCFAHPLATDVHSGLALLRKVFALIEHRERQLAARRRSGELINVLPPSADTPWVWVIIDEFPDLIKAAKVFETETHEKLNVITVLERIANKARKVGIWLVLGAQNPGVDDVGSTILRGALTATVGLGLDQQQSKTLWGTLRGEGWDSESLSEGTYLLRARNDADHKTPRVAKGVFLTPNMRAEVIAAASRQPSLLCGEEAGILTGITPSLALGETARSGAYELDGERGFTEGSRPQLSVVRDVIHVQRGGVQAGITSSPEPSSVRESSTAELDELVFGEVPDARQGGVGGTDLATQLGVSRDRVKRSFARLEKVGRVARNGDGTWSRP